MPSIRAVTSNTRPGHQAPTSSTPSVLAISLAQSLLPPELSNATMNAAVFVKDAGPATGDTGYSAEFATASPCLSKPSTTFNPQ